VNLFVGIRERDLTLWTVPAGYGKTITMCQAAEAAGRQLIWYQSVYRFLQDFLEHLLANIPMMYRSPEKSGPALPGGIRLYSSGISFANIQRI
jgi:hypothetical protein